MTPGRSLFLHKLHVSGLKFRSWKSDAPCLQRFFIGLWHAGREVVRPEVVRTRFTGDARVVDHFKNQAFAGEQRLPGLQAIQNWLVGEVRSAPIFSELADPGFAATNVEWSQIDPWATSPHSNEGMGMQISCSLRFTMAIVKALGILIRMASGWRRSSRSPC